MIRWRVKFDEGGAWTAWCRSKEQGLRSWGTGQIQAAPAMLAALERYHGDLFASHGAQGMGRASGYGPWAALRLRTLKARALRTHCSSVAPGDYRGSPKSDRTLAWSLRLRDSLATKGNTYGDAVRRMGARGITFGTRCPTALFHAAGRGGKRPMPGRMPVDDRIGPEVAIDAADRRIMEFLFSGGSASASPGLVRNAAGLYSRR